MAIGNPYSDVKLGKIDPNAGATSQQQVYSSIRGAANDIAKGVQAYQKQDDINKTANLKSKLLKAKDRTAEDIREEAYKAQYDEAKARQKKIDNLPKERGIFDRIGSFMHGESDVDADNRYDNEIQAKKDDNNNKTIQEIEALNRKNFEAVSKFKEQANIIEQSDASAEAKANALADLKARKDKYDANVSMTNFSNNLFANGRAKNAEEAKNNRIAQLEMAKKTFGEGTPEYTNATNSINKLYQSNLNRFETNKWRTDQLEAKKQALINKNNSATNKDKVKQSNKVVYLQTHKNNYKKAIKNLGYKDASIGDASVFKVNAIYDEAIKIEKAQAAKKAATDKESRKEVREIGTIQGALKLIDSDGDDDLSDYFGKNQSRLNKFLSGGKANVDKYKAAMAKLRALKEGYYLDNFDKDEGGKILDDMLKGY